MIRSTKARAPYVGESGSGSADNFTVAVSGTDTTPGYLSDKLTVDTGLDIVVVNPGANEEILIYLSGDAHPYAMSTPVDYYDDFTQSKPFWQNMPVTASGDWSVNVASGYLQGIAQNNTIDAYRYGIEGDFDHAIKIDIQSASSCGLVFGGTDNAGSAITLTYKMDAGGDYIISCTGKSTQSIPYLDSLQWLRLQRIGTTINFYDRLNDTDNWTLVFTYTDVDLGYNVTANLDSATTARLYTAIFNDNVAPQHLRSMSSKEVTLTDAATIAVDARRGNVFYVTLGGNRQMGNPTFPLKGQMIMFVVKQDAGGGRSLTWDSKYRFSSSLPAPTLTATGSKTDYLGFKYHETDDKWDYISEVKNF
jgi:hypothetical protein